MKSGGFFYFPIRHFLESLLIKNAACIKMNILLSQIVNEYQLKSIHLLKYQLEYFLKIKKWVVIIGWIQVVNEN